MLELKIKNNQAVIGIIGLGYVGLRLAVNFCSEGYMVIGFDNQLQKVDMVNHSKSYITDISDGVLERVVSTGKLRATLDMAELEKVDVIIICVPTPLTKMKDPDLSAVRKVCNYINMYKNPGVLIILESSTYPGTTSEIMADLGEVDYHLAYSPERIDPGNIRYGINNTPKLVSGIDEKSCDLAMLLYSKVVNTPVRVKNTKTAEMAKLFENVFRNVNIALVNELAILCEKMGISIWDVIEATATKPYGFMSFYPSLGVGGHCIPVDPYYLMSKAREYEFHTRFISIAAEINEKMPEYVFYDIWKHINKIGSEIRSCEILVLGVTFKKDVNDIRESPAIKLINMLQKNGADVWYNDPYVGAIETSCGVLRSDDMSNLGRFGLVIMATPHSTYNLKRITGESRLIYDTCNAFKGDESDKIIRLGE